MREYCIFSTQPYNEYIKDPSQVRCVRYDLTIERPVSRTAFNIFDRRAILRMASLDHSGTSRTQRLRNNDGILKK
jgi:hypothetical protein